MIFGFFEPDVPTATAEEVMSAIEKNEKVVILDVRTPEEHARARIIGSLNIPVDKISNTIMSKITDKNQKVFVYCLSGSRSVVAVDEMIKRGYKNVYNMKSGLLAWRIHKYPLTS